MTTDTPSPADVAAALRFDALDAAERLTGQSYKTDPATLGAGMLLHVNHEAHKVALLEATGDTHFRTTFPEYLAIAHDLGFTEVLRDHFPSRTYREEPSVQETFVVLWHPDGLLLTVETYQGKSVNSAKVLYNVRFRPDVDRWSYTSSGHGTEDGVWVGDHDAREGLRSKIAGLRSAGEFLPVWAERPWLWLLTYQDSDVDGYDHKAITEGRVSRLPDHVREAITPKATA